MRGRWLSLCLVACACGRTGVEWFDAGADGGRFDSGQLDAGHQPDAGSVDAGVVDAGPVCSQAIDAGVVGGSTPLGAVQFTYVWLGSEPPGGHSCPHLEVHASNEPPVESQLAVAPFAATFPTRGPLPAEVVGWGTLELNGARLTFSAKAHITRADAITSLGSGPPDAWRSTLTFEVLDAGWTLAGVVDTVECVGSTPWCL